MVNFRKEVFWKDSLFGFKLLLFMSLFTLEVNAQNTFSKVDQDLGKLTSLRTCFDVIHQDITAKVIPEKKYLFVNNTILFKVQADFNTFQLDLFSVMSLDSVLFEGKKLEFIRDSNTIKVSFPTKLKKGAFHQVSLFTQGRPITAKKAPWDGGFVWSKDEQKEPWIGLACEGLGASSWLPCKDHWSDEADSLDMHLQVPASLMGVSNGIYKGYQDIEGGYTQYDWSVKNPINNYNISINIAHYAHIADTYLNKSIPDAGRLTLDYYVLEDNKEQAKTHFKQAGKMLEAFEHYFGSYPFYEDGYKLVETPYWGMEHQSCIAYGNQFKTNEWGFDFILVHESGHEWFGNSITAADPADMWIHESFTTYAEALYVEYWSSYEQSVKYLASQRNQIKNTQPLIGPSGVHFHARTDNDIYYKGSWMLHTLRNVIDNDTLWLNTLKDLSMHFRKQIITTNQLTDFMNKRTGLTLTSFFNQYLYTKTLPVFEYKITRNDDGRMVMSYRWNAVSQFEMPVKVTVTKGKYETITPRARWQLIDLNYFDEADFKIKTDSYLFESKKINSK